MLLTGKVNAIEKPNPQKNIYIVELGKTRHKKKISIAITVWGRLAERIEEIKIGERWDFQVYLQSKARMYQGRNYWDSWIMAERMRKYVPGAERSVTVANQETGEVITKRKGEIPIE
jgi:hypothetical protein